MIRDVWSSPRVGTVIYMRGLSMFGWIRCLGIVLAIMAADVHAQGTGSNAKVITWGPVNSSSEIYVGILGEISKPGVYRLDPASLNLPAIVRRSGGLTDDASGSIRVVRQDRIVESLYYSPQSHVSLLAGDLLVVESKRAQAAISKLYDADPKVRAELARDTQAALRPDPTGVQVAFVNVLERPVVVKIKHENAQIGKVVQMLDQPAELAQSVRVIGPERLLSQSAAPQPIDTALADGTVLYFPRNSVNRNRLPAFPVPYDSEIATGAVPSLIGGPSGQSPELRNVGQLPPMMARIGGEPAFKPTPPSAYEQATLPTPPASLNQQPGSIQPPAAEKQEIPPPSAPIVSTPPRIATIPFNGQPRITSSSNVDTQPDTEPRAQSEPSQSPKSKAAEPQISINEDTLEVDDGEITESAKSSSLSFGQMFGIVACIGLLVGLAILTRRYFEEQVASAPNLDAQISSALKQQAALTAIEPLADSQPAKLASSSKIPAENSAAASSPESASLTTEPPVAQWIDRLLANKLPIEEEPAVFPEQMVLQGRIVPPPVFRVDVAEAKSVPGPHFAASQKPALLESAEIQPETEQVIDEFDMAHRPGPSKPHFMRRRPGENTVAAAASKSGRNSAQPDLKHSDTPVTDALRQLQGGQP